MAGLRPISTITGRPVPTSDEVVGQTSSAWKRLAGGFTRNIMNRGVWEEKPAEWQDRSDPNFEPSIYAEPIREVAEAVFAGVKARTAALDMLDKAKKLLKSNASFSKIWKDTGWFKGSDGEWRFEVPDDDLYFNPKFARANKDTPLEHVLDHPPLFEAYPHLKAVKLNRTGKLPKGDAYYNAYDNKIGTHLNPTEEDLIHEIQHAIQEFEGFARGGSADNLSADIMSQAKPGETAHDVYLRLAGEIEARDAAKRFRLDELARQKKFPGVRKDAIIKR